MIRYSSNGWWRRKYLFLQLTLNAAMSISNGSPVNGNDIMNSVSQIHLNTKDISSSSRSSNDAVGVVVVGGGLAGLSAALEASRAGAHVTLLEKQARIGGNSAKATSGINGCKTYSQEAHNIEDDCGLFKEDTLRSGKDVCGEDLVDVLVRESAQSIEYLREQGIPLNDVVQLGGHSVARTHRETPRKDGKPTPVGWDIVKQLWQNVSEDPNIVVKTGVRVTKLDLEVDEEVISGVEYVIHNSEEEKEKEKEKEKENIDKLKETKTFSVSASRVVLATGGFSASEVLLQRHSPLHVGMATTNGVFALGEGVELGVSVGAAMRDMQHVQLHPTGFVNPNSPNARSKVLAAEALRGCGGVLLTEHGKRFADELGTRDYLVKRIQEYCGGYMEWESGSDGSSGSNGKSKGGGDNDDDICVLRDNTSKCTTSTSHATTTTTFTTTNANTTPPKSVAYLILSEAAVIHFGTANFAFYETQGLFKKMKQNGIDGVAEYIGCEVEVLRETFTKYNEAALCTANNSEHGGGNSGVNSEGSSAGSGDKGSSEGGDVCSEAGDEWGKSVFPVMFDLDSDTYYVGMVTPVVHYTMGGLSITPQAEVVNADGEWIKGLFAAGEVTGGVHGANRLGGNSLLECVVFGRRAGKYAAMPEE